MFEKIILSLYFCLSCYVGCSQSADWKEIAFLPEELEESSGMVFYPPNRIVHINDGGNRPALISTDTIGNIIQNYCIPGAENQDWEELCKDTKGNLYIGDFGNNRNAREDLRIYKLPSDKVFKGEDDYLLELIEFQYEDQMRFPPRRKNRNFDTEAMIHIGDSIYLFTKNRTRPFTGYTYCYKIPDTPGYYIAEKVDSFYTGNGPKEVDWITASTFRENPRTLILLGYNKMWMFYYFEGTKFFSGKHNVLYFNTFTQKEAITFKNQNTLFLSDEKNNRNDGLLYELDLPDILAKNTNISLVENQSKMVQIKNTVAEFNFDLHVELKGDSTWLWQVYNEQGQRMHHQDEAPLKVGSHNLNIDLKNWNPGKYDLHIYVGEKLYVFKVEKIQGNLPVNQK